MRFWAHRTVDKLGRTGRFLEEHKWWTTREGYDITRDNIGEATDGLLIFSEAIATRYKG